MCEGTRVRRRGSARSGDTKDVGGGDSSFGVWGSGRGSEPHIERLLWGLAPAPELCGLPDLPHVVPRLKSSGPSLSCSKWHVPSRRLWASATIPRPGLCMPSTSC